MAVARHYPAYELDAGEKGTCHDPRLGPANPSGWSADTGSL